jgi:hypothetical protein
VIAGGDYKNPDQGGANLATTGDGGESWKLATPPQLKFFSGIAYAGRGLGNDSIVTVGSRVTGFSKDGLRSWNFFLSEGFNAVAFKAGVVYAAGTRGKIAKITP